MAKHKVGKANRMDEEEGKKKKNTIMEVFGGNQCLEKEICV